MITQEYRRRLQRANYRLVGSNQHAGVKLCLWTKKSIKTGGKAFCYKQRFYGIQSHRCLQMTPDLPFCNLDCKYCWRDPTTASKSWEGEIDGPEEIIEGSIEAQKKLLTGLGGINHSKKHLNEAMNPVHAAISLEGEPTLYPYLNDLIVGFHKRGFTTFLVTNGTRPDVLRGLQVLPSQLYLSLSSPNKNVFETLQRPVTNELWTNIMETIKIFPLLKTRKVIRLTLIKDINMEQIKEYAALIRTANPDFIECKSYMSVGYSRNRLPYDSMPTHKEIIEFSKMLSEELGWKIEDEKVDSRVVLIKNPEGCERWLQKI